MRSPRAALALALTLALPARALAQPAQPAQSPAEPAATARVAEAQQHLVAAMNAFRAHDYTAAIHGFELAYRAAPNPDLWYNLGRAREMSGDCEGAIADYQRYLRDKVDPPDRGEVERHIRELQSLSEHQAAARRRQAEGSRVRLHLDAGRRNARVYFDDREVPASALGEAWRAAPGDHAVRVTADGAQEWRATVRVREGETASVFAALSPATGYVTRPVPHIASAVLAGLGVVSLGVAGYFGVRAATDDCQGCASRVEASSRSDILLGVGASLAVGAAVAWFVERATGRTERVTSAQ